MLILSAAPAHAGVLVSVSIAPPALPVYEQPPLPAPGFIWTPGYWAYGDAGYYWVPGVWVHPPAVGLLWTPGYWGFEGGVYGWHGGYWGPHVGFYGGVNYGFGYGGIGFVGGEWRGGVFAYNSAVANFGGVHVTNVYENRAIIAQNTVVNEGHASFNGGAGIQARPTPGEMQAANENHIQATPRQQMHENSAAQDRSQLASVNHGNPGTPASSNINQYHQVAQQHVQSQPISAADRSVGRNYNPNTREANQDQRIANGLRSGQMTSGEAARAERTQSAIDQQVHNDRVANGGHLTGQERQQINSEQNAASRQIYDEKHNGATIAPNAVDNREANQQQRTANGLRSGQMTSGEAARTNQNQAGVAQQVHDERTANGGALTGQERQQVNGEQNANSRQIYNENHNGVTTAPNEVNGREANQDQRIANGLRSGQMTSGEAAQAERTQSAIDQQVHNDRVANGGTLTGQERQQINSEQNAASRQIYDEKHNGATIAPNAVDNREANQQQRTANGLRSGQMTSGEAARTNQNQAGVAQQVHDERTANGGALTGQERQQVNGEQNANSRQIYNENHNGVTTAPNEVNGREANQDQRIANGLRSGQMTSGEAARAETTESNIDQQVHNDRAANGGHLTGQERQQINREQNAASRQIYNEKHNGATVTPNAVNNREANQQQRTANGLRSGQMTSGEAARTNQTQAGIAQQVHNDRAANGGALNAQQKKQVNKEQNKSSKQIYNEKHNSTTAKPAAKAKAR